MEIINAETGENCNSDLRGIDPFNLWDYANEGIIIA
jgi:hypothetical protein